MADGSKIDWTDATWNPITGCSVVSPGCTNCYAMRLAGGRMQHHPSRAGLTTPSKAGPVWNGQVRFNEEWLDQPLRWSKPRMIFVCAHADLFHENVPDEWIDRVFAVMALAPQHCFQVLTKRAERMRQYFAARTSGDPWAAASDYVADLLGTKYHPAVLEPEDMPLRNVWLGVSAEDQKRADERIPHLIATPAAVRWVSAEPLLGTIDLWNIALPGTTRTLQAFDGLDSKGVFHGPEGSVIGIDWVVAGGESGPRARDVDTAAFYNLRDQCNAAGVAFFMKQMPHRAEIPADLMVREYPR